MDKYNQSHNKDLTAYKALRNIDRGVKKSARKLFECLKGLAAMAGFDILPPFRIRHKQTGQRVEFTEGQNDGRKKDN